MKAKYVASAMLAAFGMCMALVLHGQDSAPTISITVSGEVASPKIILVKDLGAYQQHALGDVEITNHLGEKKSVAKALRGVLLSDALETVEITAENPRVLSAYYLVCRAADGYTVVFSWKELFNSPIGKSVYLVTSRNGQEYEYISEGMMLVVPNDLRTGRRYIKNFQSIEIKRAR